MKDFAITLFFGWLGIHKFTQKKYGLGILYLLTFGLFGIGWGIDTILAFIRMVNGKQRATAMQTLEKYENPENSSKKTLPQTVNKIKIYTKTQIEGMTKAGILELAEELGYTMETVESNTKDKIVADFLTQQEKQPSTNNKKWLLKTFNTESVGTFATCDLDPDTDREEIICSLKPNSKLDLQYWEYKGEPAFYVCNKGLDAGCIPATISRVLHDIYGDCDFVVTLRGEANYNQHDDLIQKIRIDVYK